MGEFQNIYKSLYRGENPLSQHTVDQFLDNTQIPSLEDRHRLKLEAPISSEEVCAVIKNLKSHSAPDLDGFSLTYYKDFSTTHAPFMARFFNALRQGGQLDSSIITAYITVLPKPGKDPSSVSSYRPISLIFFFFFPQKSLLKRVTEVYT